MKKLLKGIVLLCAILLIASVLPSQRVEAATKISKCKITLSKTSYSYTGSACKPGVTVKYNNKKLKSGKDYTVSYSNNTKPGTATVKIKGKGKYTGTVKKTFKIKNGLTVTLSKKSYTYSGSANKPKVTVKSGKTKLKSKNYSVSYKNNVKAGTADVIVKGKGTYKGQNALVSFTIKAKAISKATISLSEENITYTGEAVKPVVTVSDGTTILTEGTDYSIVFADNINVGTATVTITGMGNYAGTVTKSFSIVQPIKTIVEDWVSLSETRFTYTGEAVKPVVTVSDGTTILTEGTDYSIVFADNINVGTATVTITGMGNYTGTVTKNFTIEKPVPDKADTPDKPDTPVTPDTPDAPDTPNTPDAPDTPDTPVSITPTTMNLKSGERGNIVVKNNTKNLTVSYASEDTMIATVDMQGEVVANDKAGTTRIAVTIGSTVLYCSVTVTKEVADGNDPSSPQQPDNSNTYDLSCDISSAYWGEYAIASLGEHLSSSANSITWSSSNTSVIQICEGENAQTKILDFVGVGTAVISATDGTVTEQKSITVKALDNKRMLVSAGEAGYSSSLTSGSTFSNGQGASSVIGNVGLEKANGKEFNAPNGMTYCKIGDVIYYFVADVYNNRVLCFTGNTADQALSSDPAFVLGQPDLNTNKAGYGTNQMNWPMSVACDTWTDGENTKYRLYVADTNNHRVLIFEDIASLPSGANADCVIRYLNETSNTDIGWCWSVATAEVEGQSKLIITGTELGRVGIYNVPTTKTWSSYISEDRENMQNAEVLIDFGISRTPRAITWTGSQLLIGDENIPTSTGGSQSGFWVFNAFPTTSGTIDSGIYNVFTYCPSIGYSEGAVINNTLYLMYASGMHAFNQALDGKYIESSSDTPDREVLPSRECGDSRFSDAEGYFLNAGGTQKLLAIDGKLYLSLLGRDAIVGWSIPATQLSSLSTMTPDLFYGAATDNHKVGESVSKYTLRNAESASDGEHMVVVSDLDCKMYVYKKIPTSDGAQPDYIYNLGIAAEDVDLYMDNEGHSTLMVTNMTFGSVYIWDDYQFDGSLPTRIISTRIGNLNLRLNHYMLVDAKYDGTYFYLTVNENNKRNVYIYRGIPGKEDNYIAKVIVDAADTYGFVSSNGTYFAISDDLLSNGKCGAVVFATSSLASATADAPLELTQTNAFGIIDSVNCGVTPTAENDSAKFNDCIAYNQLIMTWTDSIGNEHKRHENTSFSFAGDCVISKDGKVALADSGNNRVLVWDSVADAVENTANVTVLGHGEGCYDEEEMYDYPGCNGHRVMSAMSKGTILMPKYLSFAGNNLWIGEFKFGGRLLRYEMQ